MTDETPEPTPLGDPLPPMSDDEIVKYARGVITGQYMLADATDRDWSMSMMLMLSMWKPIPSNASVTFLVPMAEHQNGRWLNGRVPGVTMSAVCVPMESVEALIAKCDEFWKFLNPDGKIEDEGGDTPT
jgi:hypothetical protein